MDRKKIILISTISIITLALLVMGVSYLLKSIAKKDTNEVAQPSAEELTQQAETSSKQGHEALSGGDPAAAKEDFVEAKKLYEQAGNQQAADEMDAQISLSEHEATMGSSSPPQRPSASTGGN